MGRFDRYLFQQLLVLFGFFSLVIALVFWVNKAVSLLDWLMGDGQSAGVFLQLTLLSLPTILVNLLPVAAFAATVYATNRLASESEIVVVQAAGYSPFRLTRAVLVFGIFVAAMVATLAHVLVPLSQRELDLQRSEIAQDVTARLLTEGTFVHPSAGFTFYVRNITASGELEDIYLSNNRTEGERQSFSARRALIVKDNDQPKLLMFDGMSQLYEIESQRLSVTRFEAFTYSLDGIIGTTSAPKLRLRSATSFDLLFGGASFAQKIGTSQLNMIAEVNKRMNQAFQGIAICLIGFSALLLGGFSRFGLWRQIFLAIFLLVVVKSLDNSFGAQIKQDASLWPLRYVPTLLALAMAWFMLWKTAHPRAKRKSSKEVAP